MPCAHRQTSFTPGETLYCKRLESRNRCPSRNRELESPHRPPAPTGRATRRTSVVCGSSAGHFVDRFGDVPAPKIAIELLLKFFFQGGIGNEKVDGVCIADFRPYSIRQQYSRSPPF